MSQLVSSFSDKNLHAVARYNEIKQNTTQIYRKDLLSTFSKKCYRTNQQNYTSYEAQTFKNSQHKPEVNKDVTLMGTFRN